MLTNLQIDTEINKKFFPMGWILYCPECNEYVKQSDPQNDSRRKSVIINDDPCAACKAKNEEEVKEAQGLMGRLGTKENNNA
jgi:hypothetical protein